jgi:hypothetical protein
MVKGVFPLLKQDGVVRHAETFPIPDHPGATRHPSCIRRGKGGTSLPLQIPHWTWISANEALILPVRIRHSFHVPQTQEISATRPEEFTRELKQVVDLLPNRINIDPHSVEQSLAKVVLTLIEFIRRLLEAQALRRMEGSDLTPEQVENLGLALMKLEARMADLKNEFGLTDQDLNIDLGPLGRLI